MTYAMEGAPGIAEDEGRIIRSRPVEVPAGFFKKEDTVWVQESNPLEGGEGDVKVFGEGVGLLVDGPVELLEYFVVD